MSKIAISQNEFNERINKFQANIKNENLYAGLVHVIEQDMTHIRNLSEYCPCFEATAIFVSGTGDPVLIEMLKRPLYYVTKRFETQRCDTIQRVGTIRSIRYVHPITFKNLGEPYVTEGINL